jgi:voltage-gated potassium channel
MIKANERAIVFTALLILIIISIGVVGFMILEDFSLIDSIYMTVITISTVGFTEVHTLSEEGRIFTIVLIILSLGVIGYSLTTIMTFLIENKFRYLLAGETFKIGKKMKNHVIICGYGRNGQQALKELIAHNTAAVVVDSDLETNLVDTSGDVKIIHGDATIDDTLLRAGILKAGSLITTLPNDADNLFVVLTARALNPNLVIISRAFSESNEKKLRIAGVNSVVMPEKVGGTHMAKLIARPDTVEFLEHISVGGDSPTNIEEILCDDMNSDYINKTIFEIGVRKKFGANIIGYKAANGDYIINPEPDTKLVPNSKLFILGTPEQIASMREFLRLKASD